MIKKFPKVSVVMPSFNSSRFIESAINSVRQQTFIDWELLVVDGGSSDNTKDIVLKISNFDSRVSLVINPDDQGPAHARSLGISIAQSDFIAFLDADDLWSPSKLSIQINFMESLQAEFTYTKYRVINSQGTVASCPVSIHSKYNYPSYLFLRGIACSTVVIKRSFFTEEILQTYGLWHGEDTLWWLKLFRDGATAHGIQIPLVFYRDSEGSLSKHRLRNQASVWRIYRDDFCLSPFYALMAYTSYIVDVAFRRLRTRLCTFILGKKKFSEVEG